MNSFRRAALALIVIYVFSFPADTVAQDSQLQLKQGNTICYIGNTLAERMQRDGWLETLLQQHFPEKQLTFRNLGFSADTLTTRLRSRDFGSPDQWLTKCQADVVFAFFGYNESFEAQAGLEQFKTDLDAFVKHTLTQQYNGNAPAQLVLFSPIAHENLNAKPAAADASAGIVAANANVPSGAANNVRLKMYSRAMRQVAESNNVTFVDLFSPTLEKYNASPEQQFTINGVHLNSLGNQLLARVVFESWFGEEPGDISPELQRAVADKNWHWFHRYRTTDGYSTYGGRADLKFTDGQTNREVVQRELQVLDFMTAERDKRIWALAAGTDYSINDDQSPAFIPVISNKPGPLPDGKHRFLPGAEAIKQMQVHDNMQVNLFASEEMFPELASPVQMSFDTKGRLWVAAWPTYPHWQPKVEEMNDKLLIFSDTDSDGQADEMKVFADKLHNPTGFEFWNGGVLVGQIPDLLFLKDTDGDDVADVRLRVLHGIDSADTHHSINSFVLGPGGALYFQEGTFHHTQIETPWKKPVRVVNAGVYRFEPRTFKVDAYVSYGFTNPHGHVFDYWGQDFVTDGTGNVNYYAAPFSGHLEYPNKHRGYFPFFQQWVRPAGGTELLSSPHFPDEFQNNYLIANVIGFQGLLQYQVMDDGSGFSAEEVKPIVKSTDPNFRPVDIEIGPDGAIYFVDWQNPIIGHMQHNLRDPNRDKQHGRVYRVTYNDRPLSQIVDLTRLTIPQLLEELKSKFDRQRYRVRIELSGRPSGEVLAAVKNWVAALESQSAEYEHNLLEALWITQSHNRVDENLLRRLLAADEPRARAAATRVLCYTRDQVSDPLPLLEKLVNDPFPRVRLEAVRACSFFAGNDGGRAAEIALQVLNYPMDRFLNYCLGETMRGLEADWKAWVAQGKPLAAENEAGIKYIVDKLSPHELANMARSKTVYQQLLARQGILHEMRHEAAMGLAKINGTDPNQELLAAIGRLDESSTQNSQAALADLAHIFLMNDDATTDYAKYRTRLEQLASSGRRAVTRQIAYATLMKAEKSSKRVWEEAEKSPGKFQDMVLSVSMIDDPGLKNELAPKVSTLLDRLPMSLTQTIEAQKSTIGRFVRIELPGQRRTLTLAEVEVMSGGRNIAARGKAKQSTMGHGAGAERAIDGNNSGRFSDGSQTHTRENQANPWWELDLAGSEALDSVRIWNRTDGDLGKRLDNFTLQILDNDRRILFEKKANRAPTPSSQFTLSSDPKAAIQRAAINAVVHVSPGEAETFQALANFVLNNQYRPESIRGISRLPRRSWVDAKIQPLVANIIARVSALSAADRTQPSVLDEISLGKRLAAALPIDAANQARQELNELGINVIMLRPVPHRMQYDRSQFFVEAGKPFQIVFENIDIMPHNIVIVQPGAYAKVGIAGEEMATQPGAIEAGYVPNLPEVMHASRLLQPSQVQVMNLTAPTQPGEYPYLCTFPGHWRRMYGTMHVVLDLDSVPIEAMAPSVDPEVVSRPFVRQWKLSDFTADLVKANKGRNFERGKNLFTELSCAQCHRIGTAAGGEVGPNLLDTQKKLANGDLDRSGLLREMLEPSSIIDEKFNTYIVMDIEGRVHTGVISQRTDEMIRLLANPLDQGQPVNIPVDDIEEERISKISMMPLGLFNTCSKEEILDILSYVEAAGNKDHPAFK